MKLLYGSIILLLIGSLTYFLTRNQDPSPEIETLTEMEKLKESQKSENMPQRRNEKAQPPKKIKEQKRSLKKGYQEPDERDQNAITRIENDDPEEQLPEEPDYDDEEIPEYSEEVSSDDFQECITVAVEEIDSGEEMAEAIISEMAKIAQAQPDHIEYVRNFYRECQKKSSISTENQELCRNQLEALNENYQ